MTPDALDDAFLAGTISTLGSGQQACRAVASSVCVCARLPGEVHSPFVSRLEQFLDDVVRRQTSGEDRVYAE